MPKNNVLCTITIFLLLITQICYNYNLAYANETKNALDKPLNSYNTIERRNHIRFNNSDIKYPVKIINTDERINDLIDISREGIAISHKDTIKKGDIIPITIKYNDIEIKTSIQVVSANKKRAGGKFIVENKEILNNLLYLSIALEYDNEMLKTRLKEG